MRELGDGDRLLVVFEQAGDRRLERRVPAAAEDEAGEELLRLFADRADRRSAASIWVWPVPRNFTVITPSCTSIPTSGFACRTEPRLERLVHQRLGDAEAAIRSTRIARRSTGSAAINGATCRSYIAFISYGTPGMAATGTPSTRTMKPGAVPSAFGRTGRSDGHHGLDAVVRGHRAAVTVEALLDRLERGLIEFKAHARPRPRSRGTSDRRRSAPGRP